jgi:hypothetical protein
MEYNWQNFNNLGFVWAQLTPEQLEPIWQEIREVRTDFDKAIPVNQYLVANTEHAYELIKCHGHVEKLIHPLIAGYDEQYGNYTRRNKTHKLPEDNINLLLDKLWVNFQKKGDFNPTHNHGGAMSFVIWMDTPYSIEDEIKHETLKNAKSKVAGHFCFHYTNTLGGIETHPIPVDRSFNGRIALFPAKMNHQVYPFYTSNDYRISVSGNFFFMDSKV